MKKIILIFVITFSITCKSQVTVELPLGTYEYPNGAYLKDLNNELLPYVGTWKGVLNNKEYTFVFQKFTQHLSAYPNGGSYNYRDEIKGKLKVVDLTTNITLYDNLSATNYDDFLIYGVSKPYSGMFEFIFTDTDANCNNSLSFTLRNINGQPNQLTYCYFKYDDWWKSWDCPNYSNRMSIPVNLPMEEFVLIKQ